LVVRKILQDFRAYRQRLDLTTVSLDHKLACQYTQIDAANPEKVYSVVIEWAEGERFRSELNCLSSNLSLLTSNLQSPTETLEYLRWTPSLKEYRRKRAANLKRCCNFLAKVRIFEVLSERNGRTDLGALILLAIVRQMFMSTVPTDPALNEMSNMFGSLTTRPASSSAPKAAVTGAVDK
jgi:hypothetical protein